MCIYIVLPTLKRKNTYSSHVKWVRGKRAKKYSTMSEKAKTFEPAHVIRPVSYITFLENNVKSCSGGEGETWGGGRPSSSSVTQYWLQWAKVLKKFRK